ncbi:hypothetical protein QR685DRAFT_82686 [Neurospora intermedia]|uniref:Uncharacterized protein n=1 Tax=Neurospora intermedia TaxID=5142 RepID=A0ABR3D3L5_NEUIN
MRFRGRLYTLGYNEESGAHSLGSIWLPRHLRCEELESRRRGPCWLGESARLEQGSRAAVQDYNVPSKWEQANGWPRLIESGYGGLRSPADDISVHYTSLVWIGAPSETKMVGFSLYSISEILKIAWYTEGCHQLCGDIIVTTACFMPRDSANFMTNMLEASFRMLYQRRTRLVGDNLSICYYGVWFWSKFKDPSAS